MTVQLQDMVDYQDDRFAIVGIRGESLPTPADFGMTPIMIDNTCYRGYYATYAVNDEHLCLTNLTLKTQSCLLIDGHACDYDVDTRLCHYEGLTLPMTFSGQLLLGHGLIGSMVVPMGFHKAVAYQKVLELWLQGGQVIDCFDLSAKVAQKRDTMRRVSPMGIPRRRLSITEIAQWVSQLYSMDYDL